MVKPDTWIREKALREGMIKPFSERCSKKGLITYGLSSYGYDVRLSRKFKIPLPDQQISPGAILEPGVNFDDFMQDFEGDSCVIGPNSAILGCTVERFRIPRNVLSLCLGKSTYARCFVIANVTPLEPEWEGIVTLEISNTSRFPVRVKAGQGIAQFIFIEGHGSCETSYADKLGRYQDQRGIVTPQIR